MNFKIKNYRVEDDSVLVGFWVNSNEFKLAIDKKVPIVLGKSDEEYISDAYDLAKPEIDEWLETFNDISNKASSEVEEVVEQHVNKKWSPENGSFI
tara:strand:+ start:877 stop:1164 length:288 start_codon:yes stop_codon:yes gene_type:complete